MPAPRGSRNQVQVHVAGPEGGNTCTMVHIFHIIMSGVMVPGPLHPVTVLEQCRISPSPAPAADQPRALPLTFFDLVFWDFPPVQRLFFYDNDDLLDVPDFQASELPQFKKSLAAALHHFYPLAGKLTCELAEGAAPEIAFSDGDSVRLTLAVSGDDFHDLAGDHARDTARLRHRVPRRRHLRGHHAVADGSSYVHFMKTWAAIHRSANNECRKVVAVAPDVPPLFDRGVVRDDAGLREAFVSDHRDLAAADDSRLGDWDLSRRPGVVLATFRFTEKQLGMLGRHVESETSARCSPNALACGAAWAGIVHARGTASSNDACFGFVTGCKPRVSPPIPANYFGNCLGLCRVEAPKQGGGGLNAAAVATAIWRVIAGLVEEGRAFRDARGWVRLVREYASRRAVTVAGSPKLGVYAVDFGDAWGRPRKVEIASVERTGALALAESGRDGDGGIEVGLALPRTEMEAFRAFYRDLFASLNGNSKTDHAARHHVNCITSHLLHL
ncbi:hypothetical protein EJB05_19425, partial [Eragrostis curvula]